MTARLKTKTCTLAFLFVVLLSFGSCGDSKEDRDLSNCSTIGRFGLLVSIEDADTLQEICDATVTATDGDYVEIFKPLPGPTSNEPPVPIPCSYHGAIERAGTYGITVEREGYVSQSQDGIVVTHEVCVSTPGDKLTFSLSSDN